MNYICCERGKRTVKRKIWTVTPFFVTPDGTKVTGTTREYDMIPD